MDTRTYFNFPAPEPEPEAFLTYEAWCWKWVHEERVALERLVTESVREAAAARPSTTVDTPGIPAMPDNMVNNSATREAWAAFYAPENIRARTLREAEAENGHRVRPRRRPMSAFVADPDLRHLLP